MTSLHLRRGLSTVHCWRRLLDLLRTYETWGTNPHSFSLELLFKSGILWPPFVLI